MPEYMWNNAMGGWDLRGTFSKVPMFAFVWQSAHESGAQMGYHVWYEINSRQEPGSMWRYTLMIFPIYATEGLPHEYLQSSI